MANVREVNNNIYLIDDELYSIPGLGCVYFLAEDRKVIIDTNFILSCIRNRIDFFEELKFMGFLIIVPVQVVKELEKLSYKLNEAKVALKLLKEYKPEEIDLKVSYVDEGILRLCHRNKEFIVATLDNALLDRIVKNPRIIIRNRKSLEVLM